MDKIPDFLASGQVVKKPMKEGDWQWQCGIRGVAVTNIARDVNTVTFIREI